MAAEHRAGVAERLHVALERVDAAGEQQIRRVDPATGHGRADPAAAPAWVGGVEQPAVPAHELDQLRPGALEALAKRRGRDRARRGRVFTRELEDLAEHIRHPVLAVQAQQHPLRAADPDLLGQQVLVDAGHVVGAGRGPRARS